MRTAALAAAALLCPAADAAAQRLPLRHFTIGDGLAHNVVAALHQDALGYIWIGTLEGTSRFDGTTFVTHGRREGLPGPLVTAFAESADGRIWLATSPLGLFAFTDRHPADHAGPVEGPAAFRRLPISRERRTNANRVYSVAIDGQTLWAGTDDGLYRGSTTQEDGAFVKVLPGGDSEKGAPSFRDSSGVLWMGIGNRLVSLSAGGRVVFELPATRSQPNDIVGITEDESRRLIVAGLRGLYRHAGKEATFEPLPVRLLADETMMCLASAPRGLWLGTSHGLLRFIDGVVQRYGEAQEIGAPVLALLRRNDALWIGSTDGLRLMAHERSTGFAAPAPAKPVLRVLASDETQAVAATAATIFSTREPQPHAAAAGARIARGPDGPWWIGSDDGIFVSRSRLPATQSAQRLGAADGLHPGSVLFHDVSQPSSGMHLDGSGRMWLATSDDRLYACTAAGGRTRCTEAPHDGISWRNRPVNLTDDRRGTLWIASTSGLARLRNGRVEVIHLRDPAAGRLELSPAVSVDRRGWLWVGTHHEGVGVSRDPLAVTPAFDLITTAAGLSSDAVYDVVDSGSRVFFATGRGLDALDAGRTPFQVEPVDVGFETGVVQDLNAAGGGILWIAASAGVFRLDTGEPPAIRAGLRTYIQRLFVGGAEWALPERGVADLGPLVLRPGDDDVRLEFTTPHETDRPRWYEYRLEPGASSWSRPQPERTLTLARLKPGRYTLHVRAVTGQGDSVPAVLRFELLAPVWQRWWFRAAGVLAVVGLALGIQRARLRRVLALERVRSQIAADLHDDVGSRLAEIAVVGELGMRDARGHEHERFGQIAATARDVRQAMSDVVWAIDPRRDQVVDLVSRIRAAAEALLDPDVEVSAATPPAGVDARLPLGPHERRQVLLIAREALVNIQKHARATRVEIAYAVERGMLAISVADDGIGISAAPGGEGHGLDSMRNRASALGGTVTIEARPQGGTRVLAMIPLRQPARRRTNV